MIHLVKAAVLAFALPAAAAAGQPLYVLQSNDVDPTLPSSKWGRDGITGRALTRR